MLGPRQIQRDIAIAAPPEKVFAILDDSRTLPSWVPLVRKVIRHQDREEIGAVRVLSVAMGPLPVTIEERVIAREDGVSLTYVMQKRPLPMRFIFASYGFKLSVRADGTGSRATIETHYQPRHPAARVMNRLGLRRSWGLFVDSMLEGLKRQAEG